MHGVRDKADLRAGARHGPAVLVVLLQGTAVEEEADQAPTNTFIAHLLERGLAEEFGVPRDESIESEFEWILVRGDVGRIVEYAAFDATNAVG